MPSGVPKGAVGGWVIRVQSTPVIEAVIGWLAPPFWVQVTLTCLSCDDGEPTLDTICGQFGTLVLPLHPRMYWLAPLGVRRKSWSTMGSASCDKPRQSLVRLRTAIAHRSTIPLPLVPAGPATAVVPTETARLTSSQRGPAETRTRSLVPLTSVLPGSCSGPVRLKSEPCVGDR